MLAQGTIRRSFDELRNDDSLGAAILRRAQDDNDPSTGSMTRI